MKKHNHFSCLPCRVLLSYVSEMLPEKFENLIQWAGWVTLFQLFQSWPDAFRCSNTNVKYPWYSCQYLTKEYWLGVAKRMLISQQLFNCMIVLLIRLHELLVFFVFRRPQLVVLISMVSRFSLSFSFFFLLCVAERAYRMVRCLYSLPSIFVPLLISFSTWPADD